MEETGDVIPLQPDQVQAAPVRALAIPKWLAAIQVVLVSGVPTQLLMTAVLVIGLRVDPFGPPDSGAPFSLEFLSMMLLFDAALTALLIRIFLEMSGENSKTVIVGERRVWREVLLGVAWVPVILLSVSLLTNAVRAILPWMHTVKESPFLPFMNTPAEAAAFLVVVMLGAGIKEELARAFILHRFEHYLGGRRWGLAVFSGWFGILHVDQGLDAALSIMLLGLFWGVLYYRRRSAVITMVNHAVFNGSQVLIVLATSLGS
ncbi:MAG TPA: type II CAAX endopeptidase family protein [Vicinamibacterales bacterium]|nr:type II CAAX endopeptidase family protein [Vicinamibacterales bacterium]